MCYEVINKESITDLKRIKKLSHNSYSRKLFVILLAAVLFVVKEDSLADESQYQKFIKKTSEEITKLKETYAQLREFSTDKHVDIENLKIDYTKPVSGEISSILKRNGAKSVYP